MRRDRESGVILVPAWPTQVWWPLLKKLVTGEPVTLLSRTSPLFLPSQPGEDTSSSTKASTSGKQDIGSRLTERVFFKWRYLSHAEEEKYAREIGIRSSLPSVVQVCNFFAGLFVARASYRAVNVARNALSAYHPHTEGKPVGNHPEVCRLVKGVLEQRPASSSIAILGPLAVC